HLDRLRQRPRASVYRTGCWRLAHDERFHREPAVLPCREASQQRPDARHPRLSKLQRHPGARRLVGSRAIQDDLAVTRGTRTYVVRRGTTRLPTATWTASPFWFRVVVRTLINPWSGRDLDGRTSSTSLSTRSSSPGRTGRGQRNSSKPAPTMPPAGFRSLSTRSLMVTAAVCQPLAASPPNIVSRAASSSRWKGCGSKSAAKVLMRSLSMRSCPDRKVWPTAKSSRYRW